MLVLFGTGYGMTKETMEEFDYILEPVYGHGDYNHLSVRSAVSIIWIVCVAKRGGKSIVLLTCNVIRRQQT